MKRFASLFLLLAIGAAACTNSGTQVGPSPSPTLTFADEWDARLTLDAEFDQFWCDPDVYPVGRADIRPVALAWYQDEATTREAAAIRAHLGYVEPLTDDQKVEVYQLHKRIRVIVLTAAGDGWEFALREGKEGAATEIEGTIDRAGRIDITSERPDENATCPICLAGGTMIATPHGERDVTALRAGDSVWSLDAAGRRVAVKIMAVAERPAGVPHALARLVLTDGRSVVAAPRHPDADGRLLGAMRPGDLLDGSPVARIEMIWRTTGSTYDLLPAGPSGAYWANGILLGSTLR